MANVLDSFAEIEPSKLVHKLKLHLLTHGRYDILRFGPLTGCSTETFECYNGVWRYCSIYSNHAAPSRDTALQLADQESLKHRLTGGYWPSTTKGDWEQAGWGVRDYLMSQPMLQRLLGWTPEETKKPGIITLCLKSQ